MNDVLLVQVDQTFTGGPQAVLAEVLRIRAHEILQHWREIIIHDLHDDPESVLVVEGLVAPDD